MLEYAWFYWVMRSATFREFESIRVRLPVPKNISLLKKVELDIEYGMF